MTKPENILLSVQNFAELDEQYDMILQRINRFVDNATQGDVPKQTMSLFFKELEDYIAVVEAEIAKMQKELDKTKNLQDKTISGVLKLNISKLMIIKSNFVSILQRFSKGKAFDEEVIYQHNYKSIEEIKETERLVHEMENLLAEQEERNRKGLVLQLADDAEYELEQQEDFLSKEYYFLLAINNMHAKIHEARYYIDELTTGTLLKLKKFFQYDFPQFDYQLETIDVDQTTFKKHYDQRMKNYRSVVKNLEYCQSFMEVVEELQSYEYTFVTPVITSVTHAMQGKTLLQVVKKMKQIEKDQKVGYLIDVARLLVYSPFVSLNQLVEADPYDTVQLTKLYDAYELYQTLGELAHIAIPSQGLGKLSSTVVEKIVDYRKIIQATIEDLALLVATEKKLPTGYATLTKERKKIDDLIALHNQVEQKHNDFYQLYNTITLNKPNYTASFEHKKVQEIVDQNYRSRISILGEVIEPDHFLQEENIVFSLTAYFDYISKFYTKAKSINKKNEILLSQVTELQKSYKMVQSYRYTPWESLAKAQKKNISLQNKSDRSAVYHALNRLLEKTYNKAYRKHRSTSSGSIGTGRSTGSGWSTGGSGGSSRGGGGGGRSSGGGGSFGGSRGSSGGTSW